MPAIKILLIDSNASDRELLAHVLNESVGMASELYSASDFDTAFALYRANAPIDCLLLDYHMSGSDGPSLLLRLREEFGELPCACIMLTNERDDRAAVESIKAGAWDYLTKEHLTPDNLRYSVERATQITQLQRELAVQNAQWESAQEQLRASQIQAAELEGVRRAVATFMHELNSPLTGLLNSTIILLDEQPTPSQRQWLTEMLETCHRMTRVLRRMEALAEVRARPGSGPDGPLDLGEATPRRAAG